MRKSNLIKTGLFMLIAWLLTSCTTYYIPIESFKEQFQGIDPSNMRDVTTIGPVGMVFSYRANPIENIKCVDKSNNPIVLRNSPSIEIRFTEKNNKRTVFYFDRVYVRDTLIIGKMSRFLDIGKDISINNVKLIEIQDGHKNFKYVKRR